MWINRGNETIDRFFKENKEEIEKVLGLRRKDVRHIINIYFKWIIFEMNSNEFATIRLRWLGSFKPRCYRLKQRIKKLKNKVENNTANKLDIEKLEILKNKEKDCITIKKD